MLKAQQEREAASQEAREALLKGLAALGAHLTAPASQPLLMGRA